MTPTASRFTRSDRALAMPQRFPRTSRWITGLTPDTPVGVVIRVILTQRLDPVWPLLTLAAKHARKDIEYVHQLRVTTRRCAATLKLFEDCLSPRRRRRLARDLRALRAAAGAARDLDVLIERLQNESHDADDVALAGVLDRLKRERSNGQQAILEARSALKASRFRRQVQKLKAHCEPDPDVSLMSFRQFANAALARAGAGFFAIARPEHRTPELLHEVRIAGKRLRYVMELLEPAFDRTFRKRLYAPLSELQDDLGLINDLQTAIKTFDDLAATDEAAQPVLRALANRERDALTERMARFAVDWPESRFDELSSRLTAACADILVPVPRITG